jgi:biopolymer transport protein ExbD
MSDIQTNAGAAPKSGSKPRAKRMSTRVDLTPMVDLGFLLITFFMLTTTLAKPVVMALAMPDVKDAVKEPLKASKVLTLLLGANDQITWYEGQFEGHVDSTDYSSTGLRKVILDKMHKVSNLHGLETYTDPKTRQTRLGSYTYVIIKPSAGSRYENLVQVLDEMAICKVRYYAVE